MALPEFTPPSLDELRALWRAHRGETDVERLILEVQHLRQALLQMRALVTAGIADAKRVDPQTVDESSPLRTLENRILLELVRIEHADRRDDKPVRSLVRERS